MKKRVECRIFGRVQTVGFRFFSLRAAKRFDILGTVENMSDGSVHVVAEGEEERVSEFVSYLKKGPLFAKVNEVQVTWSDSKNEFNDFRIIY